MTTGKTTERDMPAHSEQADLNRHLKNFQLFSARKVERDCHRATKVAGVMPPH